MNTCILRLITGGIFFAAASHAIDFISTEGFKAGALDRQQGWVAQEDWVVNAGEGGGVSISADYKRATYTVISGVLAIGESAVSRVELHYEGLSLQEPTATTSMIKLGFSSIGNNSFGALDLDCGILKVVPGGYAYLRNPDDGAVTYIAANVTDDLAVEYSLTMGIDAASSFMSFTLFNLTSGTSADGSYTGLRQAVFDAAASRGLYTVMQTYMPTSNTAGIANVVIDSVQVGSKLMNSDW